VTYGRRCDLKCLELEHLLDDLEHQAPDPIRPERSSVPMSSWLMFAGIALGLVAFWSTVAWLLWSVVR
jgi:hypothetical protein